MNPFKICPKCAYTWKARDDFLEDASVCLVGFQASFKQTETGLYLFNHILRGGHCNTTLGLKVDAFLSLYRGSMFPEIQFESPACEGHCKRMEDLTQCLAECKNAVAREIMQDFSKCNG